MKVLSRDFTLSEKIVLLILALLLVVLAYRQFVELPVQTEILSAESEQQALEIELNAVNNKILQLRNMQEEMDDIARSSSGGIMGSYNNSKAEVDALNDILRDANQYTVTFSGLTRSGDLIRRNFSLQFTAGSYSAVGDILSRLAAGPYRCLLGDVSMSGLSDGGYTVSATATFYETMVGGVPDAGLPEDSDSYD